MLAEIGFRVWGFCKGIEDEDVGFGPCNDAQGSQNMKCSLHLLHILPWLNKEVTKHTAAKHDIAQKDFQRIRCYLHGLLASRKLPANHTQNPQTLNSVNPNPRTPKRNLNLRLNA